MPPSRIWLVRHAQSVWNATGRWQGQADPPLSPEGLRQAELVAARLATLAPAALYSSDLRRCAATAEAVGDATGLTPRLRRELRETDIGRWSGLTTQQIQSTYPEEWARLLAGEDFRRGGTGETATDVRARIHAFATELAATHDGAPVAVLTHGGWIRHALRHYLGHTPEGTDGFGNASLTELRSTPTGYQATTIGDRTHLTPTPTTTPTNPPHPDPSPLRPAPATGYTPDVQGM